MTTYPPEYRRHPLPVLAICSAQPYESATHSKLVNQWLSNVATKRAICSLQEALSSEERPFRMLSVPKDYVLPPSISKTPHSPLSPLTPGSELYPDGIFTPAWVQRHEQFPCAVVGLYELWDWSHEPGSPPRPRRETGPLASHIFIDPKEREKDALLIHEISERRKYFQDKGIKFAAVLVLKGRPTRDMEERLLVIKRQSGLEVKGTFFEVVPERETDMQALENTLRSSMRETVIQFYTNRVKKVQKKRSRLPPSAGRLPPTAGGGHAQPLSVDGWKFRYDYKMAYFQELRRDIDEAARSLESAYELLSGMLKPDPNNTRLPLRGKQWIELADCINIRIYTFYLCLNRPSAALEQLNFHLRTFRLHCSSWGMDEQSFEYWEWLSRQYELFSENVSIACQFGFKIMNPSNPPPPHSPNTTSPLLGSTMDKAMQAGGLHPGTVLQHPGFYYHLAAMCCSERRRRFKEMTSAADQASESTYAGDMMARLANERKVDHSSLTIELLTKSYEQFKRFRNSRMTLYLAAEIAGTYYETQKFELALKFFERIAKTYREEKWNTILTSILRWSLRCAKELGLWERAMECLVELMASSLPMAENKREDIQKEMITLLAQTDEPSLNVEIDMDKINCFLQCHVQFEQSSSYVDTPINFQVILQSAKDTPPLPLRFNAIRIVFSDPQYNFYLVDTDAQDDASGAIRLYDCSSDMSRTTMDESEWWTSKADLRVFKNQTKGFQCSIVPKSCDQIKVVGVYLDLLASHRNVSLCYRLETAAENTLKSRRRWLETLYDGRVKLSSLGGHDEQKAVRIMPRSPRMKIIAQHESPALLDESFKINVAVTSQETEAVEAVLHIEMKDAEGQATDDHVRFTLEKETQETQGSAQEKRLGRIEPGATNEHEVYLHGAKNAGVRLITMTVRYLPTTLTDSKTWLEKSETIRIPFVAPFEVQFELCAQNERLAKQTLPDLTRSEEWLLVVAIRCCSTMNLSIQKVQLKQDTSDHSDVTVSLVTKMDDFDKQTWRHGHVSNANYLFRLSATRLTESVAIPVGSILIDWQRAGSAQGVPSQTTLQLPSLAFQQPKLVVIADVPAEIRLGEPCTVTFTVHNPTVRLAEYTASMELSEAFVFSGYKQLSGRVLPLSRTTYQYRCYPLQAGKVRLPRLKVMAKQQGEDKEVPVEILGDGTVLALDNGLQMKTTNYEVERQAQLLTFVNARRQFDR